MMRPRACSILCRLDSFVYNAAKHQNTYRSRGVFMRKVFSVSLLTLLLLSFASTAQVRRSEVDWQKEQPQILQHYRNLVQINTVYGNETKAVDYLKKVLD